MVMKMINDVREKLIIIQLVKNFHAVYESRSLIFVFKGDFFAPYPEPYKTVLLFIQYFIRYI
jgi:hypothetical protein